MPNKLNFPYRLAYFYHFYSFHFSFSKIANHYSLQDGKTSFLQQYFNFTLEGGKNFFNSGYEPILTEPDWAEVDEHSGSCLTSVQPSCELRRTCRRRSRRRSRRRPIGSPCLRPRTASWSAPTVASERQRPRNWGRIRQKSVIKTVSF